MGAYYLAILPLLLFIPLLATCTRRQADSSQHSATTQTLKSSKSGKQSHDFSTESLRTDVVFSHEKDGKRFKKYHMRSLPTITTTKSSTRTKSKWCSGGFTGSAIHQLGKCAMVHHKGASHTAASSSSEAQRTPFIDTVIDRNEAYWANRVIMKIDVPFNEHSYIIGRAGNNTKRVIKSTGCCFHFPDSNRFPRLDKSNIVSITGPFDSIENARKAIRDLAPLLVTIELPNQHLESFDFAKSIQWLLQKARETGILLNVCTDKFSGEQFVTVRTCVAKTECLRQTICLVREFFGAEEEPVCFTSLEILKPAWRRVLGKQGANLQWISDWTGATIFYPRLESTGPTFFICGHLEQLLSARRCLLAFQPMSLQFNWTENNNNHVDLSALMQRTDLSIEVKCENEEGHRTVIVTGHEYQATDVYTIRSLFFPDRKSKLHCLEYEPIRQAVASRSVTGPVASVSPLSLSPLYIALTSNLHIQTDFHGYRTLPAYHYYPITPEGTLTSASSDASTTPQTAPRSAKSPEKKLPTSDYGLRRLKAKQAQKAPITKSPRHVTSVWSGQGFSQSLWNLPATFHDILSPSKSLPTTPGHSELSSRSPSIGRLLQALRLDKYIDNFQRTEVDIKKLMEMHDSDLRSIGMDHVGRRRLLGFKDELRARRRLF